MRDFFRFLDTYKNLLIFLLIQVVSMMFVFQTSIFQRNSLLSSINSFSGSVYSFKEDTRKYFTLADINEQLEADNIELIGRSSLSYEKVDKDYAIISDTLFQRRYTFQYANVISSTKSKLKNHITLDKGSKHGVLKDMGVLSAMNLVGRVEMVTENYSLVIPVINLDFKVGAKLQRSGYFGSLTWDGEDYRMASLREIPKEASISIGESVVTRGAGSLFPAGIDIGSVASVDLDEDGNFFNVQIELNTDMSKLNKVLLIKDLHRSELDSLNKAIEQL